MTPELNTARDVATRAQKMQEISEAIDGLIYCAAVSAFTLPKGDHETVKLHVQPMRDHLETLIQEELK